MRNLYELAAQAGYTSARIVAWARGEPVPGLPQLSPAEARTLIGSWNFWARPGQTWRPGPEFITDFEAGRGWGKDHAASENVCDAAEAPDDWGGHAVVVGPDPTQVKRDCLVGPSGIFAAARRRADAGTGLGIRSQNWNDRVLHFENPRGGGAGLTVHWAASSDPKSVHGLNVGLAWLDEFGVWYHRKLDEQGNNAWGALRPAIRLGLRKVIITQTPSRAPEVRELQRDAERPECHVCRSVWLATQGRWKGEVGREPWRLPTSPQTRLHPLLNTRTTVPVRTCPTCNAEVTARVRCVFGDTTDNPMLAKGSREDAAREVAAGTVAGRMRFAPRGEVDSGGAGTLVCDEHVRRHEDPARIIGAAGAIPDRWMLALATLGAEEQVVTVDPAVTVTDSSDETGVVAAAVRTTGAGEGVMLAADGQANPIAAGQLEAVALQDWTVRPGDVATGAPSSVWAPRAYRLACLWDARRIVVEDNQGGEEVLSAVLDLVARPPTEAQCAAWLLEEFASVPGVTLQRVSAVARRVAASAKRVQVESTHRRSDKNTRTEWYGRTAALGRQGILCCDWLGGPQHWQQTLGQITGYEPPRSGGRRERPRKDRGDATIAAAQILLGVQETATGAIYDPRADSWLSRL